MPYQASRPGLRVARAPYVHFHNINNNRVEHNHPRFIFHPYQGFIQISLLVEFILTRCLLSFNYFVFHYFISILASIRVESASGYTAFWSLRRPRRIKVPILFSQCRLRRICGGMTLVEEEFWCAEQLD